MHHERGWRGGGGRGRGERGRVAKATKDPQVRTLQQFVRAETEKSQATPAQKSQVTPDRSHKRPLYRCGAEFVATKHVSQDCGKEATCQPGFG